MDLTKKIENKVKEFIIKNSLIKENEKIMIALSGGSDSVCLFHILNNLSSNLNFELCAFHLNHNIRKEAKRDEDFVRDLCLKNNIELFCESVDIPSLKEKYNRGLEDISRNIRYELIDKISKENNIDKTATAHHLLDHSESVLLNIVRGSGIKGLRGIGVQNGNIIRPMLILTKEEVKEYLKEKNIEYMTDITNFDTNYSRNNIRHNVLGHLQEVNNKAYYHFYELSVIACEIEDLLNELAGKVPIYKMDKGVYILLKDFVSLNNTVKKQVLFNMLNSISVTKDISSKHVNKIIELVNNEKTTFELSLSNEIMAKRRYDKLYFEHISKKEKSVEEQNINISIENKEYFDENINGKRVKLEKKEVLFKNNNDKYIDYDKIKGNLFLRTRKTGDKFSPFGLKGSKSIKKYFIEKKIPKEDRENILLLTDDENIIAVLGYDISEKYKTDKETKNILNIKYDI